MYGVFLAFTSRPIYLLAASDTKKPNSSPNRSEAVQFQISCENPLGGFGVVTFKPNDGRHLRYFVLTTSRDEARNAESRQDVCVCVCRML